MNIDPAAGLAIIRLADNPLAEAGDPDKIAMRRASAGTSPRFPAAAAAKTLWGGGRAGGPRSGCGQGKAPSGQPISR